MKNIKELLGHFEQIHQYYLNIYIFPKLLLLHMEVRNIYKKPGLHEILLPF